MRLPTFYEQNLIPNWGILSIIVFMSYNNVNPPSINKLLPVTKEDASESK